MKDIGKVMAQWGNDHVDMIGHDAPRDQFVSLLIKKLERVLNNPGDLRPAEEATSELQWWVEKVDQGLRIIAVGLGWSSLKAFVKWNNRVPQSEGHKVDAAIFVKMRKFTS